MQYRGVSFRDGPLYCVSVLLYLADCREITHLSTDRIPKTAKHPTDCPSVGHTARMALRTAEKSHICLVFDSHSLIDARPDSNQSTDPKKPLTRHRDQWFFCFTVLNQILMPCLRRSANSAVAVKRTSVDELRAVSKES